MSDRDNDYDQPVILDRVDHAVIADSHTPCRSSGEGTRSGRPRVIREQRDGALDPTSGLRGELAELPGGSGPQLDPVWHRLGPAEISLDLVPRNVWTFLGHSLVECGDVFGILGRSE